MKTWNCTYLVWTQEYNTDIEISTWWDTNAKRKPSHSLSQIRISLQPDGTGSGNLSLNGRSGSGLCLKDWEIVNHRLRGLESEGIVFQWEKRSPNWISGIAHFSFELKNGENFTDKSISIARQIAAALGLRKESLTDYLARFQVQQFTKVRHQDKWIGFADYLRHKHQLPALLGSGWSDSH